MEKGLGDLSSKKSRKEAILRLAEKGRRDKREGGEVWKKKLALGIFFPFFSSSFVFCLGWRFSFHKKKGRRKH